MFVIPSNADTLLVATPMIFLLFVGFFRLDELWSKPKKRIALRRLRPGLDKNGLPNCMDPDGRVSTGGRQKVQ